MIGKRCLPVLWLLLTCLFWPLGLATAEEPIVVTADEFRNNFPSRVAFYLRAEGTEEIVRATFYYRVGDSPVVAYERPTFKPGRQAEIEYLLRARQSYLPPGAEIHYHWILEDAVGRKLRTETTSVVLEDVRFEWRKLISGMIQLQWYEGDDSFGQELLEACTQALDRLANEAGVQAERPVKVLIYGSQRDLLDALEPKAQEWTGGRAFSDLGIVLIAGSPTPSGLNFALRAVPHELSHVIIHQATANPYGGIPRWLDEGLAMSAEGELEPTYARALSEAVRQRRLISLRSLGSNFPADPGLATLSYAQSYSVVQYIINTYGPNKMAELLGVFREGSTYDDAIKQALGVSIDELDAEWRRSLGIKEDLLEDVEVVSTPAPAAQPALPGQCASVALAIAGGAMALARLRYAQGQT